MLSPWPLYVFEPHFFYGMASCEVASNGFHALHADDAAG